MSRLRSLVVLGSLALAACGSGSNDDRQTFGALSLFDPVASDPSTGTIVPFPFNGLFSGTTDATLNIPNPSSASFVTAANLTDGFSTTASIFTDLVGFVDYSSAAAAILIFENDASPRFLVAGVDFTVQSSPALAPVSFTVPSLFRSLREHRSRLLIEPLKPLSPSTTYIVAVTTALRSTDGVAAQPNDLFRVANSDIKLCRLTAPELGAEALCTDVGASAAAAAATGIELVAVMNATQLSTLETLRRQLIRPTVLGLRAANPTITDADLVIAWPFTTQSVGKTLQRVNTDAVARTIAVANTTLSTGDLGLGLADTADIFSGQIQAVPFFLADSGGDVNSTAPLTTFWAADLGALDNVNPPALGGAVPCGALAPPVSTTLCYPKPLARTPQNLPLLVTVPNADSNQTKPLDGWPVVIFQHGITGKRTQMLAIGPTLASAGFVTVAIDLPLHGILATDSDAGFRQVGFERTFDLDLITNATGAPVPDMLTDTSGTHFINLASLIVSRDNLRQAVADLIHLTRSVGSLDYDGGGADIDSDRIYFVGHSLGGIVGTALLGVNTEIKAATLANPGGGIAKLLDASFSFGPRIAAGLAGNAVFEGTDTYETFQRFAQHLTDPGDPINYAVAARTNHPIHLIEVIGDTVVPNTAATTCPDPLPGGIASTILADAVAALRTACAGNATQDQTTIAGLLSGTKPLIEQMGLDIVGPLTVPIAAQANRTGADLGVAVRFANGNHGSILNPAGSATNAAVTCEMQRQTATFLVTGGTVLPVGGTCPTPVIVP